MTDETTILKTRSPTDFMDCLNNLRKDGCSGCSERSKRIGNWEGCPTRTSLKNKFTT